MAIDPNSPTGPAAADLAPAIDGGLVAYRAISPLAIFALVFGVASILTFTSSYFAVFALLAIAFGVFAQRQIRRYDDVLTGAKIANLGIAVGLVFSLSALTIGGVQDFLIARQAKRFLAQYAETIRTGTLDDALFLEQPAAFRKGKTAKQVAEEQAAAGGRKSPMAAMETQPIVDLKERLASSPGQSLEYYKYVGHNVAGTSAYATGLLAVRGPTSKKYPLPLEYVLVFLEGSPEGGGYAFHVKSLKYPAKGDF